jgi:type I restriction-modification system DNA methylase subunit
MSKLLELTHERLGWPKRQEIMSPEGAGPQAIADLAKRKIETAISRLNVGVNVGVLAANPSSNRTEDPLAIVCDFANEIPEEILRETHRLAWSFSRSPMLITVEPHIIKVWTCWKRPLQPDEDFEELRVEKIEGDSFEERSLSVQAAQALQWVELATGNFFRNLRYSKYFHRDQRADQLMLEDLRGVRKKLLDNKLPQDICHDLLARIIFVEFLFQRKDSQGNAALNENILRSLYEKGVLSKIHKDLASILESHYETYQFFKELNNRFNGDLFPGKGATAKEREDEWKAEMCQLKTSPHLKLLSKFVGGKMEMATGQLCLWKRYAFDVIPLEFISSIYEEFVSTKKGRIASGVHYTPVHIVDFMLDSVLPWNSTDWDVKILDPACGSGIFLVKAYQRLIHRWRNAHRQEGKPRTQDLRNLLENNLFGVDIDPHAVRVASFSLYLAMCDELEPRHVWRKANFPRLREKTLIMSDFFAEDKDGFRTSQDRGSYDLIIGNAPWGYATETKEGKRWAYLWGWSVPNRNLGPLFLCKAAALTKRKGKIAMLQPAGTMLFNRHSTASAFRKKLFSKFKVEKIMNLAALRFSLFERAISPACIVVLRPIEPSEEPMTYVCPKPRHTKEDDYCLVIDPCDINYVYPEEAVKSRLVWTVLAWGGRRDLALIQRLRRSPFSTIAELENKGDIHVWNGFKRGMLRAKRHPEAQSLPILESHEIWEQLPVVVYSKQFPPNTNLMFERFRELDKYTLPFVIIKESWTMEAKRFKAVLAKGTCSRHNKILFSQSFSGIRSSATSEYDINTVALTINSIFAVYYFLLTGARMGSYRPTILLDDIREFPLLKSAKLCSRELSSMTEVIIDEMVKDAYGFKDSEWVLVEDLFRYTLQDFKGGMDSPGRQPTRTVDLEQKDRESEFVLRTYCEYLRHVLQAGFGEDKHVSATIFTERREAFLPVRLVGIHLDAPEKTFIKLKSIDSPELIKRLEELNKKFLKSPIGRTNGGIFYQRVARIYDTVSIGGGKVPTIFIVKPDQARYWTRSMAMRDADEIAGDILLWQGGAEVK